MPISEAERNATLPLFVVVCGRVIDGYTHSDGTLAPIPVVYGSKRALRSALGIFESRNGQTHQILLAKQASSADVQLTFFHELGHFLSFRAKEGFSPVWANGTFSPIISALRESPSVQRILARREEIRGKRDYATGFRYYTYLLRNEELFARAYAQYTITKSGDAALKAALAKVQKPATDVMPSQWTNEEFVAISALFDEIFTKIGWIK